MRAWKIGLASVSVTGALLGIVVASLAQSEPAAERRASAPTSSDASGTSKPARRKPQAKAQTERDAEGKPKPASKRGSFKQQENRTAAKAKAEPPKPAKAKAEKKPAAAATSASTAKTSHGDARKALATAVPMAISVPAAADDDEGQSSAVSYAPFGSASAGDLQVLKEAIALARRGKSEAAGERKEQLRDPAAAKLLEWAILRSDDSSASFARYTSFVRANPHWPSVGMLRRRAEGQLWSEKREPGTVFAFFSEQEPTSAKGRFALARALLAQGDRAEAQRHVRSAWRQDAFGADLEEQAIEAFGSLLSRADHKARMDARLYAEDFDTAMRIAKRLGGAELAIAQARMAVSRKAGNAGALLEAVPNEARGDPGYMFSRTQWLRRNDRIGEAAQLLLSAPRDPQLVHDTNEWWVERRLVARKLLDEGNPQAAYRIARDAAPPSKENYRTEHPFTAGWIALRFLNDPVTAARHFAEITRTATNPIAIARGQYWHARAAEAAGRNGEARALYEAAARHSAAYYGQLARARLGLGDLPVRRPPPVSEAQRASLRSADVVRALELLYATDHRDLVIPFVADCDRVADVGALSAMGEIIGRHQDARAMLLLGKAALARGHAFDFYAFPGLGIPKYAAVGPEIDRGVVYAIARQESAFNQKTVSSARALGLMQVTPAAGRYIAKKFKVAFNEKKLLQDPVYNTQMGAAEIGELVRDYGGNYALAFAAYNAGRGRVREWIERYGDPRNEDVDPIDWVERIPFSETRNYVQRVMENMQIYRARFGLSSRLTIEADLRGRK